MSCVYISRISKAFSWQIIIQWENGQRVSTGTSQRRLEWPINTKRWLSFTNHKNSSQHSRISFQEPVSVWQKLGSSGLHLPMQEMEESTCPCGRWKRRRFGPSVGKIPDIGNGNLPQCTCLENYMDRGAHWWAVVSGAAKSRKWLNTHARSDDKNVDEDVEQHLLWTANESVFH